MKYSPFRHIDSIFWKRTPIHLTFFLTQQCNARCRFCFYLSDENVRTDNSAELSLDEIRRVAKSAGRLLWLAFSGGEIFLRKDILDIAKIFYLANRPAIMLFPTNGLLTETITRETEKILDECKNSTIVVKLSLEGTEQVHDTLRGKGSFSKTMGTYHSLSGLADKYENLEIGINTVFCSVNQDNMDDIIDFVGGMKKINTHTISLIRGEVTDSSLKMIDIEKYNRAAKRLAEKLQQNTARLYRFRGSRIKAAQDVIQREMIYATYTGRKQVIPCFAGRLNIVLRETGDLYPCESFNMKLGNIRDFDCNLDKLIHSDVARAIINSINNKRCYCTHECYTMTNILFNPRMYPSLLKEYVKL